MRVQKGEQAGSTYTKKSKKKQSTEVVYAETGRNSDGSWIIEHHSRFISQGG